MSLEKKINDDIKAAMIAKDKAKLDALRSIKSELLIAKTGKDKDESGEIPESVELKLLKKLSKQRKDSAETYKEQGRQDLADDELFQLEIIESYLPEQLSDEEIKAGVQEIIKETGASSMKEMGKVMGLASKKFEGKADNKKVSEIVKSLLG
ncbi:MAG: GatB/YqeY domain-containing protein [Bacteroidales bacterium]|nr:GatB/YqeY domain-containing protein [Bacteroidales bacterium]MCF8327333.1 GatB/YqeY domain-containing protein [Bacteroidales bacterium]